MLKGEPFSKWLCLLGYSDVFGIMYGKDYIFLVMVYPFFTTCLTNVKRYKSYRRLKLIIMIQCWLIFITRFFKKAYWKRFWISVVVVKCCKISEHAFRTGCRHKGMFEGICDYVLFQPSFHKQYNRGGELEKFEESLNKFISFAAKVIQLQSQEFVGNSFQGMYVW